MNIYNIIEITKIYISPSSYAKSKIPIYNTLNYIYDKSKTYYNKYKHQQKINKIHPIELNNFKLIEHV